MPIINQKANKYRYTYTYNIRPEFTDTTNNTKNNKPLLTDMILTNKFLSKTKIKITTNQSNIHFCPFLPLLIGIKKWHF